jgi:AraC-like DNA-binding protein
MLRTPKAGPAIDPASNLGRPLVGLRYGPLSSAIATANTVLDVGLALVENPRISPIRRFDLRGVPRRELDEQLHAIGRTATVPIDMQTARPSAPARFEHMRREFGSMSVTSTEFDNFECLRTAQLARDDAVARLIVSLPRPGVRIEQGGRQVMANQGSLVVYWSIAPWALHADRSAETRTLTIPLVELGLPHLFVRDLVGRDLGSSPLGPLLHAHLAELARLPELHDDAAIALERPTVDLVRALMSIAGGDDQSARGSLSHTLATRIMIHLRGRLSDPGLTAESVAAHFGISKRYLYVVLAQIDVTFGDWVRTERLRRAAESLRDPSMAGASVAAIARNAGFVDHSSFSRAFREYFGCTPSTYRGTGSTAAD